MKHFFIFNASVGGMHSGSSAVLSIMMCCQASYVVVQQSLQESGTVCNCSCNHNEFITWEKKNRNGCYFLLFNNTIKKKNTSPISEDVFHIFYFCLSGPTHHHNVYLSLCRGTEGLKSQSRCIHQETWPVWYAECRSFPLNPRRCSLIRDGEQWSNQRHLDVRRLLQQSHFLF